MQQGILADYFLYTHGGLQYALTVRNVLEVVCVTAWLPAHSHLPSCLGNIVHRDILLPVLDSTVLGTHTVPDTPGADRPARSDTVVIVQHQETVFGLTLERYLGVVSLDAEAHVCPVATSVDASHAPTAAPHNPFVEQVIAYRNNALITFAVQAISDAVRRGFGGQHLMAQPRAEAQPSSTVTPETAWQSFMCARIDNVSFAIPASQVIEVIEDHDVTPLFKVAPCLRGLITLRGQVLARIDISQDLGLPLRTLIERNQFLVLQGDGGELALCVDTVLGIRSLPVHRLQKADTVLSGEVTRYAPHVLEDEHGTMLILSVPDLFGLPQLQPYQG